MADIAYLYNCIWSEEMENRFIEEAVAAKRNGMWRVKPNWHNPTFVEHITPILNSEFRTNLPTAYYAKKVERLFQRQNTFQFIKGHYNVYWHEQSNEITMDEETFSELATLTPLAHAYRMRGEPHYRSLCALFIDDE